MTPAPDEAGKVRGGRPPGRALRRATRSAAILGLAALGACAAEPAAAPDATGSMTLAQSLSGDTSEVVSRLTGNDNGLELRKWLIEDDEARIGAAMAQYGPGSVLGADADGRFRRNGLRFVQVRLADLPALLDALGGASVNVQGWHGQILEWRPLLELALGPDTQTLAVDGRFRRFDGGNVALLARAWTVEMEDGPHLQLELVPEYRRGQRRSTDLRQLLDPMSDRGDREPLRSMAVDVALVPGFAYLLTYEAPDTDWTGESEPAPPEELPDDGRGGVGPDAVAPPTIGQRMLWTDVGRPARGFLVFLPRIPRDLYPSELTQVGRSR